MTQIVVGIDVGKRRLDVAVRPNGLTLSVGNDAAGWAELIERTAPWPDAVFALEASGGYEKGCARALKAAGRRAYVLEPARVRFFARSRGQRAKTDPIDAQMIAAYAASLAPEDLHEPAQKPAATSDWLNLRREIVVQLTRLANQAEHVEELAVRALIARQEDFLRELLEEVEAALAAAVAADAAAERVRRLCTVPGIGARTAILLVIALPELGRVDRGAIAALVGVAPFDDQSGKRDAPRHIGGGRKHLRTGLYMPVLTGIRCNPVLQAFYRRLVARGVPRKAAIVACMRKLVGILNAMLRDGRDWCPPPQAA
jgi:transposase